MFRTLRALWLLINLIVQCSSNLHPGFSRLEHGHRLDGSVINSFPEFSFLDCVTECLVTPRCVSVNYFKGANFCELNYEKKETANIKFPESPGWVYSKKDHWPKVNILFVQFLGFLTLHVQYCLLSRRNLRYLLQYILRCLQNTFCDTF